MVEMNKHLHVFVRLTRIRENRRVRQRAQLSNFEVKLSFVEENKHKIIQHT